MGFLAGLVGGRIGRVLLVVGVLGAGGFLLYDELLKEDGPANFEATLPDMEDDFGAETHIVTVEDVRPDTGIAWAVLDPEGQVTRRVYTFETETSYSPKTGQTEDSERKEDESVREATPADEKQGQLTLSDLDPGVLTRLCEKTGIVEFTGDFALRGKTWTLTTNTGFERFTAHYDGTDVKQVKKAPQASDFDNTAFCDV